MIIKICIGDSVEFRLLLGKAKETNAVFRLLNTGGAHANGADLICAKFQISNRVFYRPNTFNRGLGSFAVIKEAPFSMQKFTSSSVSAQNICTGNPLDI